MGDGGLFPEVQERTVGFGGISATWWATDRIGVTTQVYAQSSYLDSDLDELGGSSVQVALGGSYRFAGDRYSLHVAVAEDVFSNATTDAAVQIAVRAHDPQ